MRSERSQTGSYSLIYNNIDVYTCDWDENKSDLPQVMPPAEPNRLIDFIPA